MKVSALEETVTVESKLATVDVENVAHPAVLSRADMDAIPSARNMQSLGSYVPGVHLNTPDVAGSMQVQQTYITTHGNLPHDSTYLPGASTPTWSPRTAATSFMEICSSAGWAPAL
jgi:hypothetical protein